MPIDPTGTKPGLVPEEEKPAIVNLRCKNGGCDSIQAVEVKIPGASGIRHYKCVKCHHSIRINLGGHLDI